jgi:hypothetical protein
MNGGAHADSDVERRSWTSWKDGTVTGYKHRDRLGASIPANLSRESRGAKHK